MSTNNIFGKITVFIPYQIKLSFYIQSTLPDNIQYYILKIILYFTFIHKTVSICAAYIGLFIGKESIK